jgi:hypothetical protein
LQLGTNPSVSLPHHVVENLPLVRNGEFIEFDLQQHLRKCFSFRNNNDTNETEDPEDAYIREHLTEIAKSFNREMELLQVCFIQRWLIIF